MGTKKAGEHTRGEFSFNQFNNGIYSDKRKRTIATVYMDESEVELKANAELIVDAFNTTNKVGKLPSELAEHNEKLLKALEGLLGDVTDLLNKNKGIKLGTMGLIHIVQGQEAIKLAKGESTPVDAKKLAELHKEYNQPIKLMVRNKNLFDNMIHSVTLKRTGEKESHVVEFQQGTGVFWKRVSIVTEFIHLKEGGILEVKINGDTKITEFEIVKMIPQVC